MKSQSFAVHTLYEWFKNNTESFVARGIDLEFKDSGRGSAYVRLETKTHISELAVWDHASCLDIQIIDAKSEETRFPHTGECESKKLLENHLNEFVEWLQSVEQ